MSGIRMSTEMSSQPLHPAVDEAALLGDESPPPLGDTPHPPRAPAPAHARARALSLSLFFSLCLFSFSFSLSLLCSALSLCSLYTLARTAIRGCTHTECTQSTSISATSWYSPPSFYPSSLSPPPLFLPFVLKKPASASPRSFSRRHSEPDKFNRILIAAGLMGAGFLFPFNTYITAGK